MTGVLDSSRLLKISSACLGGGFAAGFLMSKLVNKVTPTSLTNPPEKWIQVGIISQLNIYPVKSLPGVSVNDAIVTSIGLKDMTNEGLRDRVFLVVNSKGSFLTQRNLPILSRIQATVVHDLLQLEHLDSKESISVPFPTIDQGSKEKTVRIWGDKVQALDCGDEVAEWLSSVADTKGLRLAFHSSDKTQRSRTKEMLVFPSLAPQDTGTFQDETSYMLMTEESLAALNSSLQIPVTMRSFRPSIILKGVLEPWAEDFWSYIKIGDKNSKESPILKASMPCQRCKLTTIDPDTGKVRDDGEPVVTLKKLKRKVGDEVITKLVDKSAIMGTHFGLFEGDGGKIKVGDPVYAALL